MDLNLDFGHLYNKRSKPQRASKSIVKKKKKCIKKRKKKVASKNWDDSLSNLNRHKLSSSKQLEKKLSIVSKHRYYAKDLVQEQRRKRSEERRLKQEEKELENEQKQLIRRKQLLLRKHAVPNLKRAFPAFTAGKTYYDDTDSEDMEETMYQIDESDDDDDVEANLKLFQNKNKAGLTLEALSSKLSSLENELETMRLINKDNETEIDEEHIDVNNITLNMESINKTLNAAKEKKATRTLDIKLPEMPNITNLYMNTDISQPPQLNESIIKPKEETVIIPKPVPTNEDKTINTALNSLDVPSLMMLLDKLKIYFKEIQNEKKQNEEFRSTLLESVNAQNTQILHLLAQLASQQKEMDTLKNTVTQLNDKLNNVEENKNSNINNSEAKWNAFMPNNNNGAINNGIALQEIKNVIEESRPNKHKKKIILQNTDWKSISNALPPKNDCFEYKPISQQPYTIQKHQRSFLPSRPTIQSTQEQRQRINPPHPVAKPMKKSIPNIQNTNHYIEMDHNQIQNMQCNYPTVRVERFHK